MVPTEVTETSTLSIHTPGNYPKEENTRKKESKWTRGTGWKEMVTNCKPRPLGISSSGMLCFLEYLQNYTHNKSSNFYLNREKIRHFP
jgi:hypothetical protein